MRCEPRELRFERHRTYFTLLSLLPVPNILESNLILPASRSKSFILSLFLDKWPGLGCCSMTRTPFPIKNCSSSPILLALSPFSVYFMST
ncbi:hypothetical protein DL95DRAFT_383659 [Leptodontidium sp. 2 PMI_412]|nr:hypothetical protein DL95DRAFT_383659 [Leptodontidium sp. 2 PMI_412]